MKTPNPRRPIAFRCCRRLLYVYSKSLPPSLVASLSLFRASARLPPHSPHSDTQQLPFQVALALKYRARRSWISGAGVSAAAGIVATAVVVVVSRRVIKSREELPRILRAAIHGASFALFISLGRGARVTRSDVVYRRRGRRTPMRDFDRYPLIPTGARHRAKPACIRRQ